MAVVIRLRREGAKNRPFYNVVVADKRAPRDGKFIEIVGSYDPIGKNQEKQLKLERVEHWLAQGAKASDTVRHLVKKAQAKAAKA
ncbi:MAG: 30S ribosomal protein S16 [Verrucomicrobiales bacterium]|jgi:small subunit ribosomal protein S16|nr:30S ribosomal protein S16 [Verrucomicrobiales bacterium]MDR1303925.1 30S ribosomal protein S16 [Verrucomicrobiales bacterium]